MNIKNVSIRNHHKKIQFNNENLTKALQLPEGLFLFTDNLLSRYKHRNIFDWC